MNHVNIQLTHDISYLIKLSFNTPKSTRGLDALSIFDDIGRENNDCVTPDHNVVFYLRYSVHCMELYTV
jgi:hypothetical protein